MINVNELTKIPMECTLPEFVGTTVLDTIGLVIPSADPSLLSQMQLKKSYKSLGILSSRTGAAGQINGSKINKYGSPLYPASKRYQRLGRPRKLHHSRRRECCRCTPCDRDRAGIHEKICRGAVYQRGGTSGIYVFRQRRSGAFFCL